VLFKDPDATLDYAMDWSRWLTAGDSIASATWAVPDGLTEPSSPGQSVSGARAIVWLSGGTAGETYLIPCQVVTVQGRVDERTLPLRVGHR
jgi:hypothetical protein